MNSAIHRHPNDLLKFSAEQVAQWMCKAGFSDYTGDILEGSVDGKKLLALKRSQLRNYFYGDENRASDFWNLLEAIRNNPTLPAMDSAFGRSRPPPPRHGQMHLPPRPGSQGNRYPPQSMTAPQHNPKLQSVPYDDDSFSDDDTYMDDPVTLPDQSGCYHQENDSISPYSIGNAGAPDSDDETYLQMDQFQDRDPRANIGSHLNNILTRHHNEKLTLPPRHNNRLPSGCSDWPPASTTTDTNNFSGLPSPRPAARSVVANYTKWDPAKKANWSTAPGPPGNPPIQPRLSSRLSEGPAGIDQEDYLTFESPGQESPQPQFSFPQQRRPSAPIHVQEPPRRPPKSPARHPVRSSYDDHRLPMRLPQVPQAARDQLPVRPPPPPPTIAPSYPSPVKHPINDRQGSDKSNSSRSPVGSRPSSFKDPHTHIPNRQNNRSTGSSGSTSSEDLDKGLRPSNPPSSGFVGKKIPDRMPKFPINPQHRPSLQFPMPGFCESSPASANQDGGNTLLQDLTNALTKKFSQANPYLLSEPSEENSRPTSYEDDEITDIRRNPVFNPKHNAPSLPAPPSASLSQTPTHEQVLIPPRPGPKPILARHPLPPQSFNPPTLPPKSAAVARRQIIDGTHANQFLDNLATEDSYECMDRSSPKSEPVRVVEQQSYFKNIDRKTAQEAISAVKQDGAFIVRPRPRPPSQPYALTLWAKSKFYNFIIRMRTDGEYALGKEKDDEQVFSSVSAMIEYYQKHDVVLAENEGSVKLTFSP